MKKELQNKRELLLLLFELNKAIRFCQQDEVIFENLTFTQFFILDAVIKNEELRLKDLHQILSVEKSTTTRLIEPLVKQGLLVKETALEDSRVVILKLTEKGEKLYSDAWDCVSGFVQAVGERLPAGKKEEVFGAVKIFIKALQEACLCE
ncbi:MAG: MarR family transcriptional regulator [Clostridia bacterium]|nr:MarR family transcriptional regulator [Clostridia bacterium]